VCLVVGLVLYRRFAPRQRLDLAVEVGLVALDDADVVGVLDRHDVVGVFALGAHRVRGHHDIGQVHRVQQRPERGDLVALPSTWTCPNTVWLT
jgi:hypothetical protein